jgi:hypothetical protein
MDPQGETSGVNSPNWFFAVRQGLGHHGAVAEIEVPTSWAEPLRALMAEVEREAQADSTPSDLAAVSARWARVSDAVRATVRARIAAAQASAPKR